jgi:hypothetical protein
LPLPGTLLGALDLFAFCFLVIFGNVLDFRTYTNARGDPLEEVSEYDQNGIGIEERINMCQARGVCLELLRWWNTKYTTETEGEITTLLLMTQAAALLIYKRSVQQDNREGAPGCTLFTLNRQIENVVSLIHLFEKPNAVLENWWTARRNMLGKSEHELGFSIESWGHIRIKERMPPQDYGKHYSLLPPLDEI